MRGRAGYADDNLLFYVTAGLAYLDADLSLREDGQTSGSKDLSTIGGAAGLGMEWGITEALSAKAEGLFLFFNEQESLRNFGNQSGDPGTRPISSISTMPSCSASASTIVSFHSSRAAIATTLTRQRGVSRRARRATTAEARTRTTIATRATTRRATIPKRTMAAADGRSAASSTAPCSVWDDGSQVAVDSIDNPQDNSDFELDGEWDLPHDLTLGVNVEFDTYYAGGDTVSQTDWNGNGLTVELPYLLAEIGNDTIGKLIMGLSDSASDEIDNINLAGSDAIADASFDNFSNQFFLRAKGVKGHGRTGDRRCQFLLFRDPLGRCARRQVLGRKRHLRDLCQPDLERLRACRPRPVSPETST
jgi:hypothetical protein